eukprot:355627-Chlamydomonas_euryale.AAC.23
MHMERQQSCFHFRATCEAEQAFGIATNPIYFVRKFASHLASPSHPPTPPESLHCLNMLPQALSMDLRATSRSGTPPSRHRRLMTLRGGSSGHSRQAVCGCY